MLKRRDEISDKLLRDTLHKAYITNACAVPNLIDGKPYRLEPKPKGRFAVLKKYGHEPELIDGVLYARIPLGTHGADHLGIDPETGRIGCILCEKVVIDAPI